MMGMENLKQAIEENLKEVEERRGLLLLELSLYDRIKGYMQEALDKVEAFDR